jgi:hypothetical protein
VNANASTPGSRNSIWKVLSFYCSLLPNELVQAVPLNSADAGRIDVAAVIFSRNCLCIRHSACCRSRESGFRVKLVVPGGKCYFSGRTKELNFPALQHHDLPESTASLSPIVATCSPDLLHMTVQSRIMTSLLAQSFYISSSPVLSRHWHPSPIANARGQHDPQGL